MEARSSDLAEVAARSDSLERFGHELADRLHALRALGSRPALAATIAEEPALLAGRFPEGALADATLAAYADHRRRARLAVFSKAREAAGFRAPLTLRARICFCSRFRVRDHPCDP